jgi:hypothetical protein
MSEQSVVDSCRAQAKADKMLLDIGETSKHAGFKFPVALTRTVWINYVELPCGVIGEDELGRLWDILNCLRYAIDHTPPHITVIPFRLEVRVDSSDEDQPLVEFIAVWGSDDDGNKHIAVMLPEEVTAKCV